MNDEIARPRSSALLWALLFFLANLAFLVAFADRDGYEGDDINSVVPMAHLTLAKHGLLVIYRYAWQPLSYELGALIWSWFGTPTAVFLMAPVAGALTLGLLIYWLSREGRSPSTVPIALVALLGVPELWFSALYYNSTILGMPLLALAILLVRRHPHPVSALLAGLLTGAAVLLRMDFILICPLLAIAAWPRGEGLSKPILVALGVVAALAIGYFTGILDVQAVIETQRMSVAEISANAHLPGWDLRTKLSVASVSLSPVGWLLFLIGTPVALIHAATKRDWRALGWLIAAVISAYPMLNILSPKYILPEAPFLALLFVHALDKLSPWLSSGREKAAFGALALLALVPVFVSLSLTKRPPFLVPGLLATKPVGTHDGSRSYGGYLWLAMATDGPQAQDAKQKQAAALAASLLGPKGGNVVFLGGENVFDPGGMGWRHLQLLLARRGIIGSYTGPHMLRFDLGNGRWLILGRAMPDGLADRTYQLIDLRTPTDLYR
ncbi:MAG: hypothetical protein J7485_06500 [Sphingobium sp.]|nr:hypothetical protein [Sphingobium sp.]